MEWPTSNENITNAFAKERGLRVDEQIGNVTKDQFNQTDMSASELEFKQDHYNPIDDFVKEMREETKSECDDTHSTPLFLRSSEEKDTGESPGSSSVLDKL